MVQAIEDPPCHPAYTQIKATFLADRGWKFFARNNRLVVMLTNRRGESAGMSIVDFENGVLLSKV